MDDQKMDMSKMKEMMTHIKEHMTYPAGKQEIMQACSNMVHLSDEEKEMIEKLPDKTYQSSEEVMAAMETGTKMGAEMTSGGM